MEEQTLTRRLFGVVGLLGLGIPVIIITGLYIGSRAVNVHFGDVMFGFTGLTILAWIAFAGWGRRMDAARPTGELFRNSATIYAKEVSNGTFAYFPLPTRLMLILSGTVLWGWIAVVAVS